MIELTVDELRTGQTLARSIYRPNGEMLLSLGYQLSSDVIHKLRETGQTRFWIQEPGLEHILPEEILPEFLLNQAADELRKNAEHFRKTAKVPESMDLNNFTAKQVLKDTLRFADSLYSSRLIKIARTLVKEFKRNKAPYILHFTTSRNQDNYVFQNAADCAVVAIALGRAFQFDEEELENLALGAMLMDMGTFLLPWKLVTNPDRISFAEFSAIKEHPILGFEILRNDHSIPLICAHIAYQHHERQDGGGFPRRLQGTNKPPVKQEINDKRLIHRFAEIVAVADAYIGLIQPRSAQTSKSPIDAIKFLLKASGTQLNAAIVDTLIPLIPLYSVGSRVQIIGASNEGLIGATAVVSKTNPERQDRPEITLIYDAQGNWIEHEIFNLEEIPQMAIQQTS
jgi:HD-GYP domain-containing protein (c-di-GMP phosphodiesterase class II)